MANDVVPLVSQMVLAELLRTQAAGSKMRLFKNNINPSLNSVVDDFVEADFDGYAEQTISTVPQPYLDPVNTGVSITLPSHQFNFTASGTPNPNTIYGYFWIDASDNLLQAGNLPEAVVMGDDGDSLPLMVTWNTPGA